MFKKLNLLLFLIALSCTQSCFSQTWVDTVDGYARKSYLPASRYMWNWVDASLLNAMIKQYDLCPPSQKHIYFDYVKKAMDKTYFVANGQRPNAVASGIGLAFLYRETKDMKYKNKADKIYADYLKIRRTKDGAVSHLILFTELWDDTVFMIGQFLLGMYQATGDEKYLDELAKQIRLHRDKLQDKQSGLWYHGWNNDKNDHCVICGQLHWPDKVTRRSAEVWGRGNGWIVVTLSDALEIMPKNNPHWNEMAGYLKEMIQHLPELQDKKTGHWYQLPVRNTDPKNFIESSSTAMFAYGIESALRLGLVSDQVYKNSADLAYLGLREYSLAPISKNGLIPKNVCIGTCIGNKDYYLHRGVQKGKPYGFAMFMEFGTRYEIDNGTRKLVAK